MTYRLVFLSGGLAGRVRDVDARELVLGRDPQAAQVVFATEDRLVSRRHAMLKEEEGALLLLDLGSSTGTFLDGNEVAEAELAEAAPGVDAPGLAGGHRFRPRSLRPRGQHRPGDDPAPHPHSSRRSSSRSRRCRWT